MVKLALLYFLETVLFGKDQKVHISALHVELLKNLETFNKYPWGRKCYETTLNSLQRDLRKMSQEYHTTSKKMVSNKKRKRHDNKENDGIRQYVLHGFPYAFQTQVFKKLQPTPRERREEYVKFLFSPEDELDPPEVGGEDEEDMLASNGSENDARGVAAENCPENASVLEQHKSKGVCVDCKANNEENTRKLDALGKRMDQMDKKLDLIINLLGGEGKAPTEYQYNSNNCMKMEVDGEKMEAKVGVDLEEDVPDAVVIKGEEKIVHKHVEAQVNVDVWKGEEKGVREHFEAQVHVDVRSDDEANIPAEKVDDKCNTNLENTSPMVDMHNKGVSPSNNTDMSIIVYEKPPPNVPKRRPKKVTALKSPYTDTHVIKPKKLTKFKPFPNLPYKNVVHLPLCPANRAWFKTLYTPDKWLTDEHIDYALYWIRKVKFESPTAQMENCTTTDVLFQVYLPLNYKSKHWVLAEIDFIARKITVYDSETYCIGGRKFERFMELLSTLLPLLLQKISFFSKRPEIEHGEDMTPWSVECRELVPQQEKSDCGVFVIKFVEHLIHGESIDSVQADKVKYFRTYLCLNLW
ncbi:hypothetical protein Dsin_017986 [Dipteronia sinensis]|uniref:Ubiquitin-like protease family profile domain-containing protein n=1 Tax=Dipteronia sinensis TaxID=43782 RepID=A0AAE0AHG6_9ROSI|nr:hypothetical protein Dsin_017986 [Dipteronia sinensis]